MPESENENFMDAAESFYRALERSRREQGLPVDSFEATSEEISEQGARILDKIPEQKRKVAGIGVLLAAAGLAAYRISKKRAA